MKISEEYMIVILILFAVCMILMLWNLFLSMSILEEIKEQKVANRLRTAVFDAKVSNLFNVVDPDGSKRRKLGIITPNREVNCDEN